MNATEDFLKDVTDDNLPADISAYDKVKSVLVPGAKVGWYFKEDEEFWKQDGLEPRVYTQYGGIIVPRPDMEIRGRELLAEDCIIVMTSYPCEKCYPEVIYFALRKLLDNPDLVEIFGETV